MELTICTYTLLIYLFNACLMGGQPPNPSGSASRKIQQVVDSGLLFPEKEAKSVVPLRGRLLDLNLDTVLRQVF
jgi:hypothetical protein